jgi:hypothetical protein
MSNGGRFRPDIQQLETRHQLYRTEDLLALPDLTEEWIVPYMIPFQGKVVVYGTGNTYKTHVMFDLCVAVASGGHLFNQLEVRRHGPAIVNSTEGSIYMTKKRLLHHVRTRPDLVPTNEKLPMIFAPEPFRIEEPGDFAELDYILEEEQPIVVLMDPLDSFIHGDENSATETRPFRNKVNELIGKHGCSFVIIHHQPKMGEGPRGASAWYDWADSVIKFEVKEQQNFGVDKPLDILTVTSTKQRDGEKGHCFTVVPIIDDKIGQTFYAIYDGQNYDQVAASFLRKEIYRVLRDAGQPMTDTDLCAALRVTRERLKLSLDLLSQEGFIDKEAYVYRAIGGGNTRRVAAWQVKMQVSLADATVCLLRDRERQREAAEEEYEISVSADQRRKPELRVI